MYTDQELIVRCKKGDSVAQEALYVKFASRMRFVCLRYARTNFEVEDIFQEAFVKVFAHLSQFSGKGSLEGWIRRIVVNTAIDHYKNNTNSGHQLSVEEKGYQLPDLIESEEEMENMGGDLHQEELLEIVNSLPDGYRMVFNLYAIEEYSHKQVAETLGISEGTSKSQLAKARRMLKGLIQQYVKKPRASVIQLKIEDEIRKEEISAISYGR